MSISLRKEQCLLDVTCKLKNVDFGLNVDFKLTLDSKDVDIT